MSTVILSKVSKAFGSRTLFEDVNITFQPGRRYALTGPNGAGKTTLFKIITGDESPTTGEVNTPERVGILRQNIEDFKDFTLTDVVTMGNKRLWDTLQERDKLYEEEMTDEVGMRLGDLEGIIAEENGYAAESDAEVLLSGMGIAHEDIHKKMKEIPTDQQFAVLLCQAIFGEPQALFLDEPTNHLDLESIAWLEQFLFNYPGTVVVTSHDRHFLNAVATDIADIDYETIIHYPGSYDTMVAAKSQSRSRAELEAKSKEKKIAQLKEFVAKFGAGTRASQVQSRMREIDRLQPGQLKESNIQRPYIRFIPSDKPPGKVLLKARKLDKGYDEIEVIKNFTIEIERGDKIGVIGANGRGKTTLLKMLAGQLEPDSGKVELGHQASLCYFPQNHQDIIDKANCASNAFDWLREQKKGVFDQEIRSALGKMLFSGDDAFKQVKSLSGGETARLILASMILTNHNLLILDEPNNHLDLEAVSALGWGLSEYPETVIVASHDRSLIDSVANKIIAFEPNHEIRFFNGPLQEYLQQYHQEIK